MENTQNDKLVKDADSMLSQKTNEDFNKVKPDANSKDFKSSENGIDNKKMEIENKKALEIKRDELNAFKENKQNSSSEPGLDSYPKSRTIAALLRRNENRLVSYNYNKNGM